MLESLRQLTMVLLAAVSTLGSCACFALSRLIGKALAHAIWPERLQSFAEEVGLSVAGLPTLAISWIGTMYGMQTATDWTGIG